MYVATTTNCQDGSIRQYLTWNLYHIAIRAGICSETYLLALKKQRIKKDINVLIQWPCLFIFSAGRKLAQT